MAFIVPPFGFLNATSTGLVHPRRRLPKLPADVSLKPSSRLTYCTCVRAGQWASDTSGQDTSRDRRVAKTICLLLSTQICQQRPSIPRMLRFSRCSSNITRLHPRYFSASRRLQIGAWDSVGFSHSPPGPQPSTICPIASANDEDNDRAEPALSVRPFAKREKGVDFYVILTISLILFPQFKGVKQPGVLRASGRKGMFLVLL